MNILESSLNRFLNFALGFGRRPKHVELPKNFKGLVAHRGAHSPKGPTENTMEAFLIAHRNGVWGIEFDLRWTKDDVPVIFHDADLGRLFNKPQLKTSELSWAELKHSAPEIPSLTEVVSQLGGKIHFMIELKEPLQSPKRLQALKQILANLKPIEHFHFMSLEPYLFEGLTQDFPPSSFIEIAWSSTKGALRRCFELNHGFSGHFVLLSSSMARALKQKQIPFGTGFITTKGCLFRELDRGCHWLFTDQALSLQEVLNEALTSKPLKR